METQSHGTYPPLFWWREVSRVAIRHVFIYSGLYVTHSV
jgi:hypothetical protein